MRFSVPYASLVLFAAAAMAAPPEPGALAVPAVPESIAKAMALGIDVFGSIPNDAVKVDDHWVAKPGTLASAWMRAQIDLDQYQSAEGVHAEKRQWANVGIGLWAMDGCTRPEDSRLGI